MRYNSSDQALQVNTNVLSYVTIIQKWHLTHYKLVVASLQRIATTLPPDVDCRCTLLGGVYNYYNRSCDIINLHPVARLLQFAVLAIKNS